MQTVTEQIQHIQFLLDEYKADPSLSPSYTVLYKKDGEEIEIYKKKTDVSDFTTLVERLIATVKPEAVIVKTYNSKSGNPNNSQEKTHTIKIQSTNDSPSSSVSKPVKVDEQMSSIFDRALSEVKSAYTALSGIENEKQSKDIELQMLKLKMETTQLINDQEKDRLKSKIAELEKELDVLERDYDNLTKRCEQMAQEHKEALEEYERIKKRDTFSVKGLSALGIIAGKAVKQYAEDKPEVQKTLDGIVESIEEYAFEKNEKDENIRIEEPTFHSSVADITIPDNRKDLVKWLMELNDQTYEDVMEIIQHASNDTRIMQYFFKVIKNPETYGL